MNYLCPHGYLRADCNMCMKIAELIEENMPVPEDAAPEYLYDYYLDQDERLLREQEESA